MELFEAEVRVVVSVLAPDPLVAEAPLPIPVLVCASAMPDTPKVSATTDAESIIFIFISDPFR